MTKEEARKELAENLILLAEALLDDETAGEYQCDLDTGELKVTSRTKNYITVIAVTSWSSENFEEEWADIIE